MIPLQQIKSNKGAAGVEISYEGGWGGMSITGR